MTLTKPIAAMTLAELRKHAAYINHQVGVLNGHKLNECPGWKRPCGTLTPRPLCFYCVKSRSLDQQRENR